ncbi:ImmA/IrrE family metallo-endopeptidase (plasmid) [Deinococcus wulumuqiensis]|uniref:ImmA/IrrE family metallo-endopeptidase n=1 Tax=Deinococcus wulumuqiensis TaxID=980427 RepID=A0A345ILG9_9DEIO|nr:ImmA/IrrE family metallo-endopeptidase [Deinococcus wulumuqiensis]AXH00542.1 ImmA/IrrE family metallo-endopeptidase [Deinococcus wulumuqiensis]
MIGDHLLWVEKLINECEIREPPLNIYQLILFYDQLEIEFRYFSEKFEGACLTFGPAIEKTIVLNSNFDCRWYRRRFTAAHEFGHALFHDGYDFNLLSKREIKRVEMEANSFAAMLLMPQNLLEKLHSAYGFLSTGMISSIFGVSKKAAKFRLYAYYKAAPNDRKRRRHIDSLEYRLQKDFLYADIPDKVAHWKAIQLAVHGPQMMPFCLRCGRVKIDEYPKVCWGCGKDTTSYIGAPPTTLITPTPEERRASEAKWIELMRPFLPAQKTYHGGSILT